MADRFNVLSLSGGGFLGLYTIALLAALEEEDSVPLARHFDLLAGTSVGGIIALGLAAEVPARQIQAAFERNGTAIFSRRPAPTSWIGTAVDLTRFLFRPKYQALALRRTIIELVGEDARIGDLKHPVMVPAVNLTIGRPHLFKTPHHPDFSADWHLKVVDVAIATSAAPTYFPIAEVGDALYVDGGLYATAPDLLAVHEAEHVFDRVLDDVHLLSVGTTTSQFSLAHSVGRQLGSLAWWREERLVNIFLASQQYAVDYVMRHRLGDRYLRLDATQSREQERYLALDVATQDVQKTIRGLAAASVQEAMNNPLLNPFLAHRASEAVFHHRR